MIDKIYRARFSPATLAAKKELWTVLVEQFLQTYVPADASVVDIGGGYCEFINAIKCRRKYVVYLNPDVERYANPDVGIIMSDASEMSSLAEIHRVLRRGGKLLIIQPNIKYAYREYWDFIDHHIALTEKSLGEALIISGFELGECVPRFLPFSVNSSPSKSSTLLRHYLKTPIAWKIFGKQTFMVGVKP